MTVRLEDIGDLTEVVVIRGQEVQVSGLSARNVFALMMRFPEFRSMMNTTAKDAQKANSEEDAEKSWISRINPQILMTTLPRVIYAAFAICTGSKDVEAAEASAEKLPLGDQMKLLNAVFRTTFGDGILPFVKEVQSLAAWLREAETIEVPAQSSPHLSSGALMMDMPPGQRGGTRRAH